MLTYYNLYHSAKGRTLWCEIRRIKFKKTKTTKNNKQTCSETYVKLACECEQNKNNKIEEYAHAAIVFCLNK